MIAIDPSLNSTGVAVVCEGEIVTMRVRPKKLRGVYRLRYIRDAIREHLDLFPTDRAVYEDYSFGSKGRAVFDIGELGGVLKTELFEQGISTLLVPPAVLKMYTTGHGNATKEDMADAIVTRWGIRFNSDDEADAYALNRLGQSYFNVRKLRALPKKVRDSIKSCPVIE